MAKPSTSAPESTDLVTTEAQTALAVAHQVLESIPSADEDPTERMAAFIFSQPPERWEELWSGLPNVKDNDGKVVTIHAIRSRPSDFEGDLKLYLVCDVTWRDNGEKGLMTCSSKMAIFQLITLYKTGKLPATVEIVRKEKATKKGFHPIHLRYLVNYRDPVVSEQ